MGMLPAVGFNAGIAKAGSLANLSSTLVGLSNPLSLVGSIGSLLGGLGGGADISQASNVNQTISGNTDFKGSNTLRIGRPIIDLSEPLNVAMYAAVIVGAVWLYHKKIKA